MAGGTGTLGLNACLGAYDLPFVVGDRRHRVVGGLDDRVRLDRVGVGVVDDAAERRRDQHIDVERQQVLASDGLGIGEVGDRPRVGDVIVESVDQLPPPLAALATEIERGKRTRRRSST